MLIYFYYTVRAISEQTTVPSAWSSIFCGSDIKKNKVALDILNKVLETCCEVHFYSLDGEATGIVDVLCEDGSGLRWTVNHVRGNSTGKFKDCLCNPELEKSDKVASSPEVIRIDKQAAAALRLLVSPKNDNTPIRKSSVLMPTGVITESSGSGQITPRRASKLMDDEDIALLRLAASPMVPLQPVKLDITPVKSKLSSSDFSDQVVLLSSELDSTGDSNVGFKSDHTLNSFYGSHSHGRQSSLRQIFSRLSVESPNPSVSSEDDVSGLKETFKHELYSAFSTLVGSAEDRRLTINQIIEWEEMQSVISRGELSVDIIKSEFNLISVPAYSDGNIHTNELASCMVIDFNGFCLLMEALENS